MFRGRNAALNFVGFCQTVRCLTHSSYRMNEERLAISSSGVIYLKLRLFSLHHIAEKNTAGEFRLSVQEITMLSVAVREILR